MMTNALLQTKLFLPALRPNHVPRRRLVDRLEHGVQAGSRLTLICAPAGYGKTTLFTQWMLEESTDKRALAWLSLDESDDDPARFFTYLWAALQRAGVEGSPASTGLLQAPRLPPAESVMSALINELTELEMPIVLALDDYHQIGDRALHDAIAFLLEHQPPLLHLALMSREDPPFSLSKLRSRGQVVEIRQRDLVLTAAEAAAFLNQVMGLQLETDEIEALESRTEGWVAGLQLAALALRGSVATQGRSATRDFVKSFAGSSRFILDYLMEEVFQHQPPAIQTFLLKTAILERLNGSLCAAVSGQGDSQAQLQTLEEANLFLVPLDDRRQWYRYHHLFVDLLRYRSQQLGVEEGSLHDKASRWFEANGFTEEAIDHALAAQSWRRAISLVEKESDGLIGRGQITTLLRWLQVLPDDALVERPGLCENAAWALALAGRLEEAERVAERLEPETDSSDSQRGSLLTLKAYIARARHDVAGTIDLSQKALATLPAGDLYTRSIVNANLGVAYLYRGELDLAVAVWTEAARDGQRSGNHHAQTQALSFWGQALAAKGKLHQAAELQRQAIRLGTEIGAPPITARARVNLAALLLEWNDLEAAEEQLKQALELCRLVGDQHLQRDAYRTLAEVRQAQGDVEQALAAINQAHQLIPEEGVTPTTSLANGVSHLHLALAAGDMAMAKRWLERVEAIALPANLTWLGSLANAGCYSPQVGLAKARLLLAQGHKKAASALLASEERAAASAGLGYSQIVIKILRALAASETTDAIAPLTEALSLAHQEGYLRTFLDKGVSLAALLREVTKRDRPEREYAEKLLIALRDQAGETVQYDQSSVALDEQVEPISQRELQILSLLAQHKSNAEIAQELVVSTNTIKTHLRHIYEKLGVHDRRAAVARARHMNLIPTAAE